MDKFVRGARVKNTPTLVPKLQQSVNQDRLTLGEVIFALLDIRNKHYKGVSKQGLLEMVDKAWDAHKQVTQEWGEPWSE